MPLTFATHRRGESKRKPSGWQQSTVAWFSENQILKEETKGLRQRVPSGASALEPKEPFELTVFLPSQHLAMLTQAGFKQDFGPTNLIGEFDPGSERTLAACLTHASRTGTRGLLLGIVAHG